MVTATGGKLAPDVVWSRVEDGFHVGSRAGEFVGYIDRQPDGTHLACDLRSQVIGSFSELREAMAALAGVADDARGDDA